MNKLDDIAILMIILPITMMALSLTAWNLC